MGKTSTEVKHRWNAKTYQRYSVYLRKDEDDKAIKWIEENRGSVTLSDIFRAGVEALKDDPSK